MPVTKLLIWFLLNYSRVKNGKVNDRKWQLQSALENLILALRVFSFISHFEMHNLMVVNLLLVVFYQPSAAARTSMGRDRQMSRCPWLFQQQFPLHPLRPVITLQSLILDFLVCQGGPDYSSSSYFLCALFGQLSLCKALSLIFWVQICSHLWNWTVFLLNLALSA